MPHPQRRLRLGRRPRILATAAPLAAAAAVFAATGAVAASGVPSYTQIPLVASGSGPVAVAAGPNGSAWFTITGAQSAVGELAAGGSVALFSSGLGSKPYNGAGTITEGPDGNLWFTEQPGGPYPAGLVGSITPSGTIRETSAGLHSGQQPNGIALGPDGNLWITDSGTASQLVQLTPAGTATDFTSLALTGAQVGSPTPGPDGNVWFTVSGGPYGGTGGIGRVTPGGSITVFTSGLTGNGHVADIVAGPGGNLWFTQSDPANGGVGWITPSGSVTELPNAQFHNLQPHAIAEGADGNLYVDEVAGAGTVVQITPSGTVSTVISSPSGHPGDIAAGPGGDVWVAQTNQNGLGHMTTAAPAGGGAPGATGMTGTSGASGATGTGGATGATGTSSTGTSATPPPGLGIAAASPPVLGASFTASATGLVLVRTTPHGPLVQLAGPAELPMGAVVDASSGTLRVTLALAGDRTQTASIGRGRFTIRQPRAGHGMTHLVLVGGSFAACPGSRRTGESHIARGTAKPATVIRKLWSKDDHGHFQTYGHNSVATVRGTEWLTEDRCDGTLTRVIRGAVTIRPRGSQRSVTITAGHSYLATRRP